MKKISFHKISKLDKSYTIYLDSDHYYEFGNLRKANDFLTEVSGFFNEHFHSLNSLYIQSFSMYREYYFLFDRTLDYLTIKDEIRMFEEIMDMSFRVQNTINGKVFVYNNTRKLYKCLNTVLMSLMSYAKSRSTTSDVVRLSSIKKMLNLLYQDFERFDLTVKQEFKIYLKIVA